MNQMSNERLYNLSEKDFKFVVDIVYQNTGIVLGEQKREMVYRRLMRCVRAEKLSSITEYCDVLRRGDDDELHKFFNAITTNLTNFYREKHHFDYLQREFLPELIKTNASSKRIRIWSAACSTGEEPYSIGITVAETMKSLLSAWDVKILATDIDSEVLSKAKSGIYPSTRVEEIDKGLVARWFHQGIGKNVNSVRIDNNIRSLITFNRLNLLEKWPMKGPFDVIFCRNVLIYFDRPTQDMLIERYFQYLRPGGLLMLGHSENLSKEHQPKFLNIGRTIFKKPVLSEVAKSSA